MPSKTETRFIFGGSAVAFGGRMQRPLDPNLKAAAAINLPETGGRSEAHVNERDAPFFHVDKLLTFREARAIVQGDFPDQPAELPAGIQFDDTRYNARTSVYCQLAYFQIDTSAHHSRRSPAYLFEAENLELRFESLADWSDEAKEVIFDRTLTPTFHGISVTVHGTKYVLEVTVTPDILSGDVSQDKLDQRYRHDEEFRKRYAHCFDPYRRLDKDSSAIQIPFGTRRIMAATFIKSLAWKGGQKPPNSEISCNLLTIGGLGKFYFGEILLDRNSIRPNLLRCELDLDAEQPSLPCKANIKCVELSADGVRWPPTT